MDEIFLLTCSSRSCKLPIIGGNPALDETSADRRRERGSRAMATTKFDPKKLLRNRCVGWDPKEKKARWSGDYQNEDGSVNAEACKRDGIEPGAIVPISVADLPPAYAQSAKTALEAHAKEAEMDGNDLVWKLVLEDAMQKLVNRSVNQNRPVTDKAKDRAISTLRKILEAQGKSGAEIDAALKALA